MREESPGKVILLCLFISLFTLYKGVESLIKNKVYLKHGVVLSGESARPYSILMFVLFVVFGAAALATYRNSK